VLTVTELSIMLSKIAIGLAAAAIAMGGSASSASAHHGGGGGAGPPGGKVSGLGPHGGGGRYVMGDRYRHDHWRGGYSYRHYSPYRYSYGGSCWRWTPEGRVWVCGSYGPSYRYGYYRGGWGQHHGGYGFAPHGGGRHFR
jgi:hypothetical protein